MTPIVWHMQLGGFRELTLANAAACHWQSGPYRISMDPNQDLVTVRLWN